MHKTKNEILACLPKRAGALLSNLANNTWDTLEEIRIRKCGPIILISNDKTMCIDANGKQSQNFSKPYVTDLKLVDEIVHICTGFSPYAYEKYLSEGYVTVRGGHRVGICGTAITVNEKVRGFKNVSSVNIRIARNVENFGINIAKLINNSDKCLNTVIVSPPKCGKTTLLRNLARQIGGKDNMRRVCVADERGEICAMHEGIPQFDVGFNTCVIDGCSKIASVEIALRTMSPEVIICDEIYNKSEADILQNAVYGGVSIIYAVHGKNFFEVASSERFNQLTDITECCVELSNRCGPGTVENVRVIKKGDGETHA